jgi:hypothetical protein
MSLQVKQVLWMGYVGLAGFLNRLSYPAEARMFVTTASLH